MKNSLFYLLFIIFVYFQATAQKITVSGTVRDKKNNKIENVSVILYNGRNIYGYTYTDSQGIYSLASNISIEDSLKLEVNSLGFKSEMSNFKYNGENKIIKNFILVEDYEQLEEVVLEAWEKIKINQDTISFRASSYLNGTTQVVEDLLKNLPGVEILDDGSIKVSGRFIDKLLIEGDDLFDKKYKLLSKNLDAQNIQEVQIINNFEDNPVLRDFKKSEKIALNLKLKENKKNILFGNIEIGYGNDKRYELSSNIGLLKEKIKFFNLTNINNVKKTASTCRLPPFRTPLNSINNYYLCQV